MTTASEHHVMVHQAGDSDSEEWLCPECGRHLILRWAPEYDELVLVRGDASVTHAGSKQGLVRIGPMRPSTPADGPATTDTAWRDWLDQHGVPWPGD
jgi:hypothetical protein